jgi:putative ABC transport system substrate-binding protein
VQVEYRWTAGQPDLIHKSAVEFVATQPDLIMGNSTPSLITLRKETQTVPIVFVMVSDPVEMGACPEHGAAGR